MNADATASTGIRVWDLPTRLFHWTFALCFVGAWLTAENEGRELLHLLFGYSFFGLLMFRLLWGFIGSRYARFSSFVFGPRKTFEYLRSMLRRSPAHHMGHNPIGAVAVWLMLGLGLGIAITGWMMASGRAGESLEEVHEILSNTMLILACLHILGVITSSMMHRENLPRAMLTGRKNALGANDGIARNAALTAALLAAALLAFWGIGLSQRALPFGLSAAMEQERDGEAQEMRADTRAEGKQSEEKKDDDD